MRSIILLICISFILAVSAFQLRDTSNWTKLNRSFGDEVINFRVALKNKNLDILEATFLDVSNPQSPNYGKYWTIDQIQDLVAPDFEISNRVVQFLEQNGCFNVENHRDMIKASAKSSDVERIFKVQMFNYKHNHKKNQQIIRSDKYYTIPSEIRQHIDLVTGISELPLQKNGPKGRKLNIKLGNEGAPNVDPGIVIPQTIQNIYGIPPNYQNNNDSTLCLAEFQDDASYNKKDLQTFATKTSTTLINVDKIVGPFSPSDPDPESTLDVQYGGSTAQTASVWFWTVEGWMFEFSTDLFNANPAPYVVSMSWGWPEPLQCQSGVGNCQNGETSEQYVNNVNTLFQKIGLRGITLLAASGDQGAPGDGNSGCSKPKDPLSTIFPGASPYVTSVGATMLAAPSEEDMESDDTTNPPVCNSFKCATSTTELVCTYPAALITTGGGFSNYSPLPSWQSSAVNAYLKSGVVLPSSNFFNSSNRGFPDISALGHNYYILLGGSGMQVDGTSCSSPVIGGMVAMLNSYRLNNGKPTLGFINQLLYQAYASNPAIYNDITTGNNFCTENCCAKTGYTATKGWDPVTGLGTPNFKLLLAYVQSLN
eukprot:gene3186-3990_t